MAQILVSPILKALLLTSLKAPIRRNLQGKFFFLSALVYPGVPLPTSEQEENALFITEYLRHCNLHAFQMQGK